MMTATESAIKFATTVYRKSVKAAKNVLKKGSSNKKLGFKITKSHHRGKRLYSLTLEERATCPTSCHHWADCYGNNMPFAHRFSAGGDLLDCLAVEVPALLKKHPEGILIRLHVLGDFYSVEYVRFWELMLQTNHKLAIYGYTARFTGPIFRAINVLNVEYPERCKIRFSRNETFMIPGVTFAANETFKGEGIYCPEQTGKAESCAKCGLCWAPAVTKTIIFKDH